MTDERDGQPRRRFAGEPRARRSRAEAIEAKDARPPQPVPGRRTLSESLDPVPVDPAPVDVARVLDAQLEIVDQRLAVLEAANQAADHHASGAAAAAIRGALRVAEKAVAAARAKQEGRAGALALRLASAREAARSALGLAFTPSAAARREVVRGADRTQWDAEVAAWRAARGRTEIAPHREVAVGAAAASNRSRNEPAPAASPQHAVAARGVAGAGAPLPYLDMIGASLGASLGASPGASRSSFAIQRKQDSSGPWEHMFGEASVSVNKLGRVQARDGRTLRQRPDPGSAPAAPAPLPFNTPVVVLRRTTQPTAAKRWCYVTAPDSGAAGFCEERYLAMDPPEPHARLRRVEAKELLGKIARDAYGEHVTKGNDERLYVQGLYEANKDRAGVKLTPVELSWRETWHRRGPEERTLEFYRGIRVLKGMSLWIPSNEFMQRLKASGAITSGSSELSKAWRAVADSLGDAIEVVTYAAGFTAGMIEGAWSAIVDLFKGAAEMVEAIAKLLLHLVTGNPGRIRDMLMKWADKMRSAWERRGQIADEFMKKWNAPGGWDRGQFQGEVLGWVMMTVLIIVLTAGSGAAASAGSLAARFPQVVKLLKTVDVVGDVTTYLGGGLQGLKAAGRLPRAASDIVKDRLGLVAAAAPGAAPKSSTHVGSSSGGPRDPAAHAGATGKPPDASSAGSPDVPAVRNRGEPYGDPRVDPTQPRRYLEKHELVPTSELSFATTWRQAAKILKKMEGTPIGRKLHTAAEGHEVIARLARGDASALRQLGIEDIPRKFDTTGREWALIETRDGFVILAGRYSRTELPVAMRPLAHSHPGTTPAHRLKKGEQPVVDLPVPPGGMTFGEMMGDLASFSTAKKAGITPSVFDIHVISDGGDHVIYTRYVHRGDGKIDNPKPGDVAARVNLHLSGTRVVRFNKRTQEYWYKVDVHVKDSSGKSLWQGDLYAYWKPESEMLLQVTNKRPNFLDRAPSGGWQNP